MTFLDIDPSYVLWVLGQLPRRKIASPRIITPRTTAFWMITPRIISPRQLPPGKLPPPPHKVSPENNYLN